MICNTYVQFFKTMADPAKLEILMKLKNQSCSVGELSTELGHEQSRVSHNLRKLKELGFVVMVPNGKQRMYSLDEKAIKPLLELTFGHVDKYYHKYCTCKGNAKVKRWR